MTPDDEPTEGRVAVVTDGGSGIGRATALRLLADGARVVLADLNTDNLARTVRSANAGDRLVAVHVDVRSESDVAAMIAVATDRFGRLDVLVNNAAVGGAFGALTEIEVADWDFTFAVIARGAFLAMKHGARVMGPGASIVNVASIGAYSGATLAATAFCAAKAAVLNLTMSAAVELAPRRIRVNAVASGLIRTPLLESGAGAVLDEPRPPGQPWPRWGQPADIAAAVAFLAGAGAEFVTGQTIVVDGGLTAAGPGPDYQAQLGTDLRTRGLVGVNRGTTGEPSAVRRRGG